MFHVKIKNSVKKELRKVNRSHKWRISNALRALGYNPYIGKALEGDLARKYCIRVWPYRILYEINKKDLVVIVVSVKHRQNAYK